MTDSTVLATALLAYYLNNPEGADEYAKSIETPKLRMVRSLLKDCAEVAEAELRARGIDLQRACFSAEEPASGSTGEPGGSTP